MGDQVKRPTVAKRSTEPKENDPVSVDFSAESAGSFSIAGPGRRLRRVTILHCRIDGGDRDRRFLIYDLLPLWGLMADLERCGPWSGQPIRPGETLQDQDLFPLDQFLSVFARPAPRQLCQGEILATYGPGEQWPDICLSLKTLAPCREFSFFAEEGKVRMTAWDHSARPTPLT